MIGLCQIVVFVARIVFNYFSVAGVAHSVFNLSIFDEKPICRLSLVQLLLKSIIADVAGWSSLFLGILPSTSYSQRRAR